MSDPEVHKKLDEIHKDVKDVKGEFKTLHDRADREVGERAHGLQRIFQTIVDMEHRLISWWRGKE